MSMKIITEFSEKLAQEISERKIYDLEEISNLIRVRLKFCIRDLIMEYSTQAEIEYIKLLDEQSKHKIGSIQYISFGYKLSSAKQKKAAANRAANCMGRNDDYQNLKDFISHKFGKNALNEFYNKDAPKTPEKFPIFKT